jgi:transcription elongation factor Elf1
MTITMIGPMPDEPTLMQHTFACPACGHSAEFKFKKKDAA